MALETARAVPSELARSRSDFIRRLFAVIVSVGFANEIIRVLQRTTSVEIPHILLLLAGLLMIIESWDGYFSALENRPLEQKPRFYLDTIIVFAYLVLLTVSNTTAGFLLGRVDGF